MASIVLNAFGGMVPRRGETSLPQTSASIARNCLLLSGELRALHQPRRIKTLQSAGTRRVFRVPYDPEDLWVEFADDMTHFLKGPLVNDAYDRYYWTTSDDVLRYNPAERIADGLTSLRAGVPAPVTAPTVTPQATGGAIEETRAYVYTFVTEYGEEGPPSDPTFATGDALTTWDIAGMDVAPSAPYDSETLITKKRIYRTVTGTALVDAYYFVVEVPIGTAAYADDFPSDEIALNDTMESQNFDPPPVGLQGIVLHPNGFFVGYAGRDLYFSETYRPHAYPTEYILATEDEIVGLGVYGTSVVVLTKGAPYTAAGSTPAAMTLRKSQDPMPCLSHWGIVSSRVGVFFPSRDGLVYVNDNGFRNITKKLVTRDEWANYSPHTLQAALYDEQYIAFYTDKLGFMINPDDDLALFSELDTWWRVATMSKDARSGDVYLVYDGAVQLWNPEHERPVSYHWRSKLINIPRPCNFGAYRIDYRKNQKAGDIGVDEALAYNAERIQYPLDTLNHHTIGTARKYPAITSPVVQNKQPLGGSPLHGLWELELTIGHAQFRLYGDYEKLRYTHQVDPQHTTPTHNWKLPTGYKADYYYIDLQGTADIFSFKMATTAKELAGL